MNSWGLGATAKFVEAKLSDVSAHAFGFDFGGLYQMNDQWSFSSVLSNLGTRMTFLEEGSDLPLAFRMGMGYQPQKFLSLLLEGVIRRGGADGAHLGVEYRPIPMISLRTGYRTDTTKELGALAGFSISIDQETSDRRRFQDWAGHTEGSRGRTGLHESHAAAQHRDGTRGAETGEGETIG